MLRKFYLHTIVSIDSKGDYCRFNHDRTNSDILLRHYENRHFLMFLTAWLILCSFSTSEMRM